MINKVSEKQILNELRGLDSEQWSEVLDFIGYLKHRASSRPQPRQLRQLTARELLQSELVGLWADRDDIGDSLTFARRLRWQAEHRWEASNDLA